MLGNTGENTETANALELAPDRRSEPGGQALAAGDVVLGKYRVGDKLGAGGMGEVYEATHLQLGSRVALKLPLGRAAGKTVAARLLREAQVAASLDPERVVRVFDVGTLDDGTPVIVLERLDGESLATVIARGAVDVSRAVGWVKQACAALAEAHERGIVHRDVKPSNLFLEARKDKPERVRVLDFGIARIRASAEKDHGAADLTDSRAPLGSPPYMSPEQLKDSALADARADVWALGVTLFELVTGARPFGGQGSALVASILSDPVPTFASLGLDAAPALEATIRRCLERDPNARPRDAAALGELLEALPKDALRPPERSRSFALAVAGLGALALLVTVVAENARGTKARSGRDVITAETGAPGPLASDGAAEAPAENALRNGAPQNNALRNDAPQNNALRNDALQNDGAPNDSLPNDVARRETAQREGVSGASTPKASTPIPRAGAASERSASAGQPASKPQAASAAPIAVDPPAPSSSASSRKSLLDDREF